MKVRGKAYVLIPAMAVVFALWISDSVRLQGESTVYTAYCNGGSWQANQCTGSLVAGERFRFRAIRSPGEVLFWTVGSSKPSGKFEKCKVRDGSNWSCNPDLGLSETITLQMTNGIPTPDTSGVAREFHQIPKWRWLLMRLTDGRHPSWL
jgi:hypothetical protein